MNRSKAGGFRCCLLKALVRSTAIIQWTIVLLEQGQNMGPAESLALYHRMNSLPEVQEIIDALMRATTCSIGAGSGNAGAWAI